MAKPTKTFVTPYQAAQTYGDIQKSRDERSRTRREQEFWQDLLELRKKETDGLVRTENKWEKDER
jgi:hypothetical protein